MSDVAESYQRDYCLHGLRVRVRCDHATVSRGVDNICSYFGLGASGTLADDPSVSLDFSSAGRVFSIPVGASCMARFGGVEVWMAEDELYLSDGVSVAYLDPDSGTAVVGVRPSQWLRPDRLQANQIDTVILCLVILCRYRDLYSLHAAALSQAGLGCLIVADGGGGKSTMSLNLVRQGWSYLSDDSVLLRPTAGRIEALGFRRKISIDPEGTRDFPEMTGRWQACPFAEVAKRHLEVGALFPRQIADSCVPRLLVFPKLVPEPRSRLRPLSDKAEILGRLMRESRLLVLEPKLAPRHLDVLKRLLPAERQLRAAGGS